MTKEQRDLISKWGERTRSDADLADLTAEAVRVGIISNRQAAAFAALADAIFWAGERQGAYNAMVD